MSKDADQSSVSISADENIYILNLARHQQPRATHSVCPKLYGRANATPNYKPNNKMLMYESQSVYILQGPYANTHPRYMTNGGRVRYNTNTQRKQQAQQSRAHVPTRTQDQVAEGIPGDLDVLKRPQDVDGAVRQNNPRPRCVLNRVLRLAWNVNMTANSLASTSMAAI
jgi:hypothetical protein